MRKKNEGQAGLVGSRQNCSNATPPHPPPPSTHPCTSMLERGKGLGLHPAEVVIILDDELHEG